MFISSSIQQTFNEVKCLFMTYAPGMGLDSRGRAEKKANFYLLWRMSSSGKRENANSWQGVCLRAEWEGQGRERDEKIGVRVQGDLSKSVATEQSQGRVTDKRIPGGGETWWELECQGLRWGCICFWCIWATEDETKNEMVGWHHWFNGHELGHTLGDGEG